MGLREVRKTAWQISLSFPLSFSGLIRSLDVAGPDQPPLWSVTQTHDGVLATGINSTSTLSPQPTITFLANRYRLLKWVSLSAQ
jgi:hypothetical protein